MVDQLTYNRMLRRGGFLRLPCGRDADGVEWFWVSLFEPRADRHAVVRYLRKLFTEARMYETKNEELGTTNHEHRRAAGGCA